MPLKHQSRSYSEFMLAHEAIPPNRNLYITHICVAVQSVLSAFLVIISFAVHSLEGTVPEITPTKITPISNTLIKET